MYSDPENIVEILDQIKSQKTLGDVKNLMDKVFPGLFVCSLPSYSQDYPHLTDNWHTICGLAQTTPKEIIILDNYDDQSNELIKQFADLFTSAGFVVRKKIEYFPCKVCQKALPNQLLYNLFQEKNFKIPPTWSETCQSCSS